MPHLSIEKLIPTFYKYCPVCVVPNAINSSLLEFDTIPTKRAFKGFTIMNSNLSNWLSNVKSDDIDGGLAADFDGSLSGLGVELGANTYNMR